MRVEGRSITLTLGQRLLFESLDFTIEGPGTVSIMGPSGSGKSTLLGLISKHILPDSGTVDVHSAGDATDSVPQAAWIFQNSPLLNRRSAIENVMLEVLLKTGSQEAARRKAVHAMRQLGILHLARTQTFRLSGGEKQRIAVARAVAADAELILADEPTASLDSTARQAVCHALDRAADQGALVIVATHDSWVAESCARNASLKDGRLVG